MFSRGGAVLCSFGLQVPLVSLSQLSFCDNLFQFAADAVHQRGSFSTQRPHQRDVHAFVILDQDHARHVQPAHRDEHAHSSVNHSCSISKLNAESSHSCRRVLNTATSSLRHVGGGHLHTTTRSSYPWVNSFFCKRFHRRASVDCTARSTILRSFCLHAHQRTFCSLPVSSESQLSCSSANQQSASLARGAAAATAAAVQRSWRSRPHEQLKSPSEVQVAQFPRLLELQHKLKVQDDIKRPKDWGTQLSPKQQESTEDEPDTQLDWRTLLQCIRETQQRVTGTEMLTDTFRRHHTYLRISLTERCNLRCQYCMPAEGVDLTPGTQLLSVDELSRLARIFAHAGITKVRLTGGEPTVRRDIVQLTRMLSQMPGIRTVGITTNGIALSRMLPSLKEAGLNALNISLDTLDPNKFERLTRRPGHQKVMKSIHTALEMGFSPLKINVVVMRGVNDDEIPAFTELTRHQPINVRFIEYMPFDGNVWSDRKMVSFKELKDRVDAAFPQGLQRLDDPYGEVAKNYRVPGFVGSVSFITSMTHNFCGECNRLRLLADGSLKVCLHGATEVSLREAMREGATDEELKCIISAAVNRKKVAHAGMFELARGGNRAMIKIGG